MECTPSTSSSSSSSSSSSEASSPMVPAARQSPTSFFSSPRLDRESSSSSDETEIATPPSTTSAQQQQQQLKSGPRAHYRTTDMLQFEGRDSPRQVWICDKKPSSPLPGYVTPSEQPQRQPQHQHQLQGSNADDCYFAGAIQQPDCLHLGHRPTFVHSETVPDVHALVEEQKRIHNLRHPVKKVTQSQKQETAAPANSSEARKSFKISEDRSSTLEGIVQPSNSK